MKVSVSVVTYNHQKYIAQCLDSILMQETAFGFDIIVGDDVSNDGTREIVEKYAERYPDRVKTVLPAKNLGDAGRPMFVETTKYCRGQYIAMVDGDDYWTDQHKLQKQADYLDNNSQCSLCYHDAALVSESPNSPAWVFVAPGHPEFITGEDIIRFCSIPACSAMIRKEVMQEFPSWFFDGPWADVPLYLMAAEHGLLGYIDEPMGAYRVHDAGVWQGLDQISQINAAITLLESLEKPFATKYGTTIRSAKSWQYVQLLKEYARIGDSRRAMKSLASAIYADPTLKLTGYAELSKAILRKVVRKR